jgi:hypothetical protein
VKLCTTIIYSRTVVRVAKYPIRHEDAKVVSMKDAFFTISLISFH